MIYEHDMGATHAEFFRLLPMALCSDDFEVDGSEIRYAAGPGMDVKITLGQEAIRKIALIEIPTMPVRIELSGFSDEQATAFKKLFDRAYQRGGG